MGSNPADSIVQEIYLKKKYSLKSSESELGQFFFVAKENGS